MMLGFGHGLLFLLPLLFLAKFFWIVILALFIGAMIRRFSFRHAQRYAYTYGAPSAQPSALDILRQRYARGEIDAVTFEQMREQLESSSPRGYYGIHPDDNSYPRETRSGYRDTFSSPISLEQRDARMAKRARNPSEPKD